MSKLGILVDQRDKDVLESYYRCEASDDFFVTFYDLFFSKSPDISRWFANTDMQRQQQIVMASLLTCLRMRSGDPVARRAVEELAEFHGPQGLNIPLSLYDCWLDALCEAVKRHDSHYTPLLAMKWRNSMQDVIALFKSKY